MVLVFGPFELDPVSGELRRNGRPVELQPKLLAMLLHLVLHRDPWVRKEELLARVWPGVRVGDAAVSSALHDLREALGDDGREQAIVRTMRRRGYRFVAPVEERARPGRTARRPAAPFVGRAEVLAALEHALDEALAGHGGLVLLAGEPGIGKSRTAQELCARARARGVAAHAGACSETGGAPPYWPWLRVLRGLVAERDPTTLRAELDWRAPRLALLLPELRSAWPNLPSLPREEGEPARFQLFEAVSALLARAADERGLLIHLDDLHRADEGSLALLRFLAPGLGERRLLVVAGHRDAEADRSPALDELLAATARLDACTRLPLAGLAPDDVRALVGSLLDAAPDDGLLRRVQERTDGNPFLVRELVAAARRGPDLDGPDPASRAVPYRVRDSVRARLATLSPAGQEAVRMAAVVGRELEPALLAQALDLPAAELTSALEEAIRSGLLTEQDDGLRFAHALVRDAVYETGSRSGRAHAHRRLAEALERLEAADPDARIAALAHHYAEAVPAGARRQAIRYAHRAGRDAARRYALHDAAAHFERALALLEGEPSASAAERCDLLLELGHACEPSGLQERQRDAFRRAAAIARELGDGERLARAAVGFALGILIGHVDPEARQLLEEALAACEPGDSSLRIQLIARLAHLVHNEGQLERADALLAEAAERADRTRDLDGSLALIKNRGNIWMARGALPERQLANRMEGIELAERAGDRVQELRHRAVSAVFLLALGDRPAAEQALARAAAGARSDWMVGLQQSLYAGLASLATGALGAAERAILDSERIVASLTRPHNGALSQLFFLRREQARLAEVAPAFLGMAGQPGHHGIPGWHALLLAELGQDDEARRVLALSDRPRRSRDPIDAAIWIETCDVLCREPSEGGLSEELSPYEPYHLIIGNTTLSLGPTIRYLGLLHLLAGELESAERCFLEAQARSRAMGWTLWERYAQLDEAKLRLTRHGPGDASRARELASAVLVEARPAGLVRLARRAEALLAAPGRRRRLEAV